MNSQIIEKSENGVLIPLEAKLITNRVIVLSEDIINVAGDVYSSLMYLDSVSHDRISLYINSSGGYCTEMFGICDMIENIKSPVDTYCFGEASSGINTPFSDFSLS